MDLNLVDKVFIISGSSRGIGRGIARVLLDEGAKVVLTGLDPHCLSSTYAQMLQNHPGSVLQCPGDLNEDRVLATLEELVLGEWSQIDGLIANAGAVKPVEAWQIPYQDWEWYFNANFKVAVRFVTHFVPHLQKGGAIVFVGSIAGMEDIGAPLPYSSSKAALAMYAKGLARKLAGNAIRVNTVSPGNIRFPDGNWDKKMKSNPDGIQSMLNEKVPLKRFGSPEEIGYIVAFLLSEKASFMTGSGVVVDGGQTCSFI